MYRFWFVLLVILVPFCGYASSKMAPVASSEPLRLRLRQEIKTLAWIDDTTLAIAGRQQPIKLWRVESDQVPTELRHGSDIQSLAISPDGSQLLAGGRILDSYSGSLMLWQKTENEWLAATLPFSPKIFTTQSIRHVAFLPNRPSTAIVTSEMCDIGVIDLDSKKGLIGPWETKYSRNPPLVSPLLGDDTYLVAGTCSRIARSGENKSIFTVERRSLDGATSEILLQTDYTIDAMVISPNYKQLALVHLDERSIGASYRGNSLSLSLKQKARLTVYRIGKELKEVWSGIAGSSPVVAFSPDGRLLATGGTRGEVQFWNAADGSHLQTIDTHSQSVNTIAFSPNGQYLATGSNDRTVVVRSIK